MTNFNSINNLNFNNIQNKQLNKIVDNNHANNSNFQNNILAQADKTPRTINPSLMFTFETAKMDNETLLKYLKSLLELPNSIEKFIQELNSNNKNSKLIKILVQNLINTKALSEFLNENSKVAMDEILQTISNSIKIGNSNNSEFREIFSILTSIQSQTQLNTNTLREFLLLYIPINYQAFNEPLEFRVQNSEMEENIQSSELSIMFETVNFSNVLCVLNSFDLSLDINFYANKSFPFEKFKKIIDGFSKEMSLNTFVEFKNIKENELTSKNQNFKIISKENISSNVLLLSHLIIKTVFKIDDDFNS